MEKKKKISAAKQKIIQNYESQRLFFSEKGYEEKTEVISILKANAMVFITAGPFIAVEIILWIMIRGASVQLFGAAILIFILFIVSTVVHEIVHGIGWAVSAKKGWSSIYLGMMWESLTPYCHCKEALSPKRYLAGALAPFLVMGVGMYLTALVTGSNILLGVSVLNTLAAGGDLAIIVSLVKYIGKTGYILDHPTDCGFVIFVE